MTFGAAAEMGADTFHFDLEAADVDRVGLDTAYMISRRGWPVDAEVTFDRDACRITSRILASGGSVVSAALALQVELPAIGTLKLRTTLLPPRPEPYDLMLELARERIRQYLQKCEDWQMFAPAIAPEARERFEQARELLASAVLASDRAHEAAHARDAVVAAVQAGELLAATYADIILHRRYATSAAAETSLGFRVDPRTEPPANDITGLTEFGVILLETPWNVVQPEEGHFEFGLLDRWMEWAARRRRPVVLGPLVDLRPEVVPRWAAICKDDYQLLCKLLWEHQEQIVARYADHAAIWCVASGVHVNRLAHLKHEQMIDLTRRSAVLVRQGNRSAKVLVELVQPFDDEVAEHEDSVPGYEYAVRTLDEGVHVDCFGLKLECGLPRNGCEVRDLLSLSDAIDRIGRLERPLMITGFSVPEESGSWLAGTWHEPWTPERQGRWAASMFGIALGKMTHRGDTARDRVVGVVESVLWNNLQEVDGEASTGLLDSSGVPRRVLSRLAAVRRALRRPLGKSNLQPGDLALDPEGITK